MVHWCYERSCRAQHWRKIESCECRCKRYGLILQISAVNVMLLRSSPGRQRIGELAAEFHARRLACPEASAKTGALAAVSKGGMRTARVPVATAAKATPRAKHRGSRPAGLRGLPSREKSVCLPRGGNLRSDAAMPDSFWQAEITRRN